MQIRAFVILTSLGLPDLNMKEKNEVNSGVSSKKRSSCKWPIDTRMIIYLFSCRINLISTTKVKFAFSLFLKVRVFGTRKWKRHSDSVVFTLYILFSLEKLYPRGTGEREGTRPKLEYEQLFTI